MLITLLLPPPLGLCNLYKEVNNIIMTMVTHISNNTILLLQSTKQNSIDSVVMSYKLPYLI